MKKNIPRLIGGPYCAPTVNAGDVLHDMATDEDVIVGGLTETPIPWPRRLKSGRPSLILCDDLAKAVRIESASAICYWWGVGYTTVSKWRNTLGVDRMTDGTRELYRDVMPGKLTPEVSAIGRERAAQPEAIAKMRAARIGVPAPENVRAGLLEAAKRPKSDEWRAKLSERNRHRERPKSWVEREWTPEEDSFLGTAPDREVAEKLGRPLHGVRGRRRALKIPAYDKRADTDTANGRCV